MFTSADKDASYDVSEAVTVELSGENAAYSSENVTLSAGLLTVSATGIYKFTGNGTNISIVVNAENAKVRIVLSDVTLANDNFAALYVKNADKVFVILEGDNAFSVADDFIAVDENSVDGVIFAKDDVTIQGNGSLTVNSSKHGIVGKDDLKFTGGEICVNASSHGIQANDSVRIVDSDLTIASGKDGIQVENTEDETKGYIYFESGSATITAGYDGLDASGTIQITGGSINIIAGNGSGSTVSSSFSSKGIKAQNDILVTGGTVIVNSADDSVHSNDSIEISGGELTVASGDDGVHADTSLIISGGTITISKSYEGLEAQNVNISSGKISVKSSDDGINAAGGNDGSSIGGRPGQNSFNSSANGFITISGGEIYVDASGDGVDSNGNLTVSGGTTIVEGPTSSGNGALDYDGTATVSGGTFVAIGASGMAMNFSSATQGSILLNIGSQSAGAIVSLKDADGNEIFSMTATKSFSSVLITDPSLIKGNGYTVSAGSSVNTVTLSSYIYGSGSGAGGGPGSVFPGGIRR
ncbi:MAG: carbohydrate-binding domain-containing protein [Christensenellales bacterium]